MSGQLFDYSLLISNSSDNGTCGGEKLESDVEVALGVVLAAAAFVAYIPQVAEIIWKRTADGVSFWSIFLAHTAGVASLLSGMFLKWDILYCCFHVSFEICAESLLVVISLFVPVIGQSCIWICVLLFFNCAGERDKKREHRLAILACLTDWLLSLIASGTCVLLLWKFGSKSPGLRDFANAMGYAGTTLTCIQWLPQIWKTWQAQCRGSLSLVMLLIQCPGSVVIVLYFIIRHYPVPTWLSYAVASFMQAILIAMITFFYIRDKAAAHPPGSEAEAQEPLLTDNVSINNDSEGSRRRF